MTGRPTCGCAISARNSDVVPQRWPPITRKSGTGRRLAVRSPSHTLKARPRRCSHRARSCGCSSRSFRLQRATSCRTGASTQPSRRVSHRAGWSVRDRQRIGDRRSPGKNTGYAGSGRGRSRSSSSGPAAPGERCPRCVGVLGQHARGLEVDRVEALGDACREALPVPDLQRRTGPRHVPRRPVAMRGAERDPLDRRPRRAALTPAPRARRPVRVPRRAAGQRTGPAATRGTSIWSRSRKSARVGATGRSAGCRWSAATASAEVASTSRSRHLPAASTDRRRQPGQVHAATAASAVASRRPARRSARSSPSLA